MFCSIIIPTIARPSLSNAVASVLAQQTSEADFEVIVVNDSGMSLPSEAWQQSKQVTIVETNQRERCVARNTGAAIAKGEYLYFLDDDDWLLPEALEKLWQLAQKNKDAVWLYGSILVVDNNGRCLAEINSGLTGDSFAQVAGGAWAPIQVSLIKTKTFFAEGGFDPHITATQDLDLCRRIALHGDFVNISEPIGCLLRDINWGSVTDYEKAVDFNRISRDALLDRPKVFNRLIASANSDYWYGRVVHIYISAILLNLRHRRVFKTLNRSVYCLLAFILAQSCLFSTNFWHAIKDDQIPGSLYEVLLTIEQSNRS